MAESNRGQIPIPSKPSSTKARILCLVDGPDWIFQRHVKALERHLSDEFDFSVAFRGQPYEESAYDLIYPLEFNMVTPQQIERPSRYVTGIRSFVAWADWDFLVLCNYLSTQFQKVHVVSKQLYNLFAPYLPGVRYVTHGIDTDFFKPSAPARSDAGSLRLGWAGNRQTFVKGFREFIEPLGSLPGIELVYCGFADRNLTMDEMPGFYQSIDAYVCASSFEGNNNSLLEAAAMQRAILTTPNGTVPEYLQNNQSALIVERDTEQYKTAALRLRDNPDLRAYLGKQARESLLKNGWDWRVKAEDYRLFFRAALEEAPFDPEERLMVEPVDFRHYASLLQTQYRLERDLRIGYATQSNDLAYRLNWVEAELAGIKTELDEIKKSLWHRLGNRLSGLAPVHALSLWLKGRKKGK